MLSTSGCILNLSAAQPWAEIASLFHLGEKTSQQTSPCLEGPDGRGQHQICSRRAWGSHSDVHGDHSTRYGTMGKPLGFKDGVKFLSAGGGFSVASLKMKINSTKSGYKEYNWEYVVHFLYFLLIRKNPAPQFCRGLGLGFGLAWHSLLLLSL